MATLRTFQWWALAAGFGFGCSINHAGLSGDAGPGAVSGTGGAAIVVDGGTGSGGATPTASGGNSGTGGSTATGGRSGTGGGSATGGLTGSGGFISTSTGGSGGPPGTGGGGANDGTGGTGGTSIVTGTGGAPGTGGSGSGGQIVAGTGGQSMGSGGASSGGAPGTGGMGTGGMGTGGRAGTGGRMASCTRYPEAMAFVPPGDDRTHCYWFRNDMRTWPAARTQCQNETGGDLVTITSQAENEFVRGVARFSGEFPQVWIGATDDRPGSNAMGPGTYHWVTNEAWGAYTNWNQSSPKQPDGYCDPCNNNQPCTCDHRGTFASDGTWYDFWQDNPRGYVCEAIPAN